MTLEQTIRNRLKVVKDGDMYSPDQIVRLGVVLNIKFEPSLDRVYRLIKRGLLPATNLGDLQARFFVKGKDLREFAEKRYLNIQPKRKAAKKKLTK